MANNDIERGHDEQVITVERTKSKKPPLFKVIMHNDDYTTMEFVIMVLQKFFHMGNLEANNIMLTIHKEGAAICGIYTYEIAETKKNKVLQSARDHGHPLECTIEEE